MLLVKKCISELENKLKDLKDIIYNITINIDTTLTLNIVGKIDKSILDKIECKIFLREYSKDEYKNDEFVRKIFEKKINWSYKKRFSSFEEYSSLIKDNINIPIVAFYSYKGGVGRTTALNLFANYLSYHKGKKVVIIDFDFEAPGMINVFNIAEESKNGVIEFILDSQTSKKEINFRKDYSFQVSKEISGNGEIYIIPTGDIKNIDSYIEGLARIDLNSSTTIIKKILNLLETIKKEFSPDIILIDSRTGINDVFGLLSHYLSTLMIGFFSNSEQNKPGLKMFLKYLLNENAPQFILVNSQIHYDTLNSIRFKIFEEIVKSIIEDLQTEDLFPSMTYIYREPLLAELGTEFSNNEDYIDFIKNRFLNTRYKDLFETIESFIDFNEKEENNLNLNNVNNNENIKNIIEKLLEGIKNNYPKPYGDEEEIEFDDDFFNKRFYFRKCMEDIFDINRFLILGSKGTGKTYFYRALEDGKFLKNLQIKANNLDKKFKVCNIISLEKDKSGIKFFPIDRFIADDIKNEEFFYERFWQVYILNSLALEKDRLELDISFKPIKLDGKFKEKERKFFLNYIYTNFEKIESELYYIDEQLKIKDINLLITFDQLDFIVRPLDWDKAISPLIRWSIRNPYLKIQPKLFLRKDLYEKLSNITNKQSLNNRIIKLEWDRDEIFGFFFKVVFGYEKERFFKIMNFYKENILEYKNITDGIINMIKKYAKERYFNQIPLEDYYIKPLVEVFFGKNVYLGPDNKKKKKYGGSAYNWFYKNLQNADGTISIRPFLDLIENAINEFLKSYKKERVFYPILPPSFYTAAPIRKEAVKRHFKDLADEKGNEDFKEIILYIKDNPNFPLKLRKRILIDKEYDEFLEHIKDNVKLNNNRKEDIENTLKINGVIKVEYISGHKKRAIFAYLYKYFLGLKN
jgi:cellulose biosynthesis protein BcsQ